MDGKVLKWLFIAMGAAVIAPSLGVAAENISKNNARRDIIVACYQAGNKDCDTLWNKEIR